MIGGRRLAVGVVARLKWAQFVELATAPCFVAAGAWIAGLSRGSLWSGALGLFVCWPLAEWWLHRSLLHRVLRTAHWHHHEDPMSDIHVTPFLPDAVLLAIFGLCVLIGGRAIGGGLFAGFAAGYATFYYTHLCVHAGFWPKTGWLGDIARRHDLHHRGIEANYNVLLPLGDWIFRTYVRAS
jgi:sterol desaturase/sphingolipid hydroxylase (fatty acid hydroxylase superfamily)